LKEHGQILTQFDNVEANLHKLEFSEARELAVDVVELLRRASAVLQQSFVLARYLGADVAQAAKTATARSLFANPPQDGIVGLVPQIEEALRTIGIGFPESEDGSHFKETRAQSRTVEGGDCKAPGGKANYTFRKQ
jgi:hypothetical protein